MLLQQALDSVNRLLLSRFDPEEPPEGRTLQAFLFAGALLYGLSDLKGNVLFGLGHFASSSLQVSIGLGQGFQDW